MGPLFQNRDRLIALQNELCREVSAEFEFRRSQFRRLWAKPLRERLWGGRCIAGLVLERRTDEGVFRFRLDQANLSDLREGDGVRLSADDPTDPLLKDAHIYCEHLDWLELKIPGKSADIERRLANQMLTADVDFLDLEDLFLAAIVEAGRTTEGVERILPLLDGQKEPQVEFDAAMEATERAETAGANDAQAEAIALAASTDLCHLVKGPPGTGKTFVLAQVVKQRLARGERILVCGATHRGIHNALAAIRKSTGPGVFIGKVGPVTHSETLNAASIPQAENFHELPFKDSGGEYVIGATPFATRGKRLRGVEFDSVVFDEASQVTVPLAIMGMLAGKTYLFFGDDKQLPPVLNHLPPRQSVECSVFRRLNDRGFDTFLDTTYRMCGEITDWASVEFYRSGLAAHERNAAARLALIHPGNHFDEMLEPAHPMVAVMTPTGEDTRHNAEEANLVVNLLAELVDRGVKLADIGVVTPYRHQAREVRRQLYRRSEFAPHSPGNCTVDTVERMQGQEREVVICTMTANSPAYIANQCAFLYQRERLNVTVTRARTKFIWIVSKAFFPADVLDTDFAEDVAFFQTLREACREVQI